MVTVALTAPVWDELRAALDDDRETAGVITARAVEGPGGITLLGRRLDWASPDAYLDRKPHRLSLRSSGWVPAVRAALAEGSIPVFVHTHPRGLAVFSQRDDEVDASLRATLPAMGGGQRYAALVVAGTRHEATVAGRLYDQDGSHPMSRLRVAGEGIEIITARPRQPALPETFDRQIRMFGAAGQDVLAALHVGIVGTGGTGSACAEQLTRLGAGHLTLVDDDVVTDPTPTRGYGMTVADTGRPKAEVLAEYLRKIGLPTEVSTVTSAVQNPAARHALSTADVVFSCVDGHGARLILNRWAYAHLAPVIDVAVLVSSDSGASRVTGIDGRVTWLGPGTACLLCRGRIDPALAYAEILDPEERKRLAGEGYVREADTRQPAVVTLTSLVASLATTELLQRLFGLADLAPTEVLALVQRRELRRNRISQRPGCFCSDPAFLARGTQPPHLDLTWPG
jgi:molybdopterin/thiamine biosynthesis adenylyltransferase